MSPFACIVRRDLLLAFRRRSDVLNTLVFFVIVVSLFPLGVGPEPNQLRAMAPGVIWVAALEELGVGRCAQLPVRALSQGQRRRVSLARLALGAGGGGGNGAALWILDEPFAALDTAAVAYLENLIARHVDAGGMAVLTTHQPLAVTAVTMLRIELDFEMDARS